MKRVFKFLGGFFILPVIWGFFFWLTNICQRDIAIAVAILLCLAICLYVGITLSLED